MSTPVRFLRRPAPTIEPELAPLGAKGRINEAVPLREAAVPDCIDLNDTFGYKDRRLGLLRDMPHLLLA